MTVNYDWPAGIRCLTACCVHQDLPDWSLLWLTMTVVNRAFWFNTLQSVRTLTLECGSTPKCHWEWKAWRCRMKAPVETAATWSHDPGNDRVSLTFHSARWRFIGSCFHCPFSTLSLHSIIVFVCVRGLCPRVRHLKADFRIITSTGRL